MTTTTTLIAENEKELVFKLGALIEQISNKSILETNTFKVGVSGGSLVKFLSICLPQIKTDFTKWLIFFCDERIVPENDKDSTYGVYKQELLGKIDLTDEQFIKLKQGVSAEEAAVDYTQQISHHFNSSTSLPQFDLLLLGMGPDGHTCSLFPGHRLLGEDKAWVAPITDSPKPPPARITLTYPVINNARCCVFAMAGEGKADMVKRILVDKEDLPATKVRPTNGDLYWILDKAAAKHIQ